jgi:two-component system response regulator YesN
MLESLKNIISSNYGNECEIHTAKTGRVVVEEAEKYPPDICFMDIQMPGLSGIQAIREIQKFNRSVVFVIITAYDKFNYAKEAVNYGISYQAGKQKGDFGNMLQSYGKGRLHKTEAKR